MFVQEASAIFMNGAQHALIDVFKFVGDSPHIVRDCFAYCAYQFVVCKRVLATMEEGSEACMEDNASPSQPSHRRSASGAFLSKSVFCASFSHIVPVTLFQAHCG